MTPTVNRCLADKAMDHIDHALGRPVDPMGETYRDHFACGHDSAEAKAFRASPHWTEGNPRSWAGTMAFFYVTDKGRAALRDHLRAIGDPNRLVKVRWGGYDFSIVAKSRSAARYRCWCDVRDAYPDLSFGEFCREAWVRLAPRAVVRR